MEEELILRIRDRALSQAHGIPFPPAPETAVGEAEITLGFRLPMLLRLCYLKVGNGGFGPGYGLIGLKGGFASDYGTIVETYQLLKGDQESEGRKWKPGLLPFCEWGCNIFSCVDCNDIRHPVYRFENFAVRVQNYNLQDFFGMWINGVDILSHEETPAQTAEIINPFTGEKMKVTQRPRK